MFSVGRIVFAGLAVAALPIHAQFSAELREINPGLNEPREGSFSERPSGIRELEEMERQWVRALTPRAPEARGSISVNELRKPLEGKPLKLILKAQELIARGEIERAKKVLEVAKQNERSLPYALSMLATIHLKASEFDLAISELQEANRILPWDATTHSNLAYALGAKGQSEAAAAEARKALQLDPSRLKTRFVLGQVLLQMGQREEAKFHLELAAQALPGARRLLNEYFRP
jgi:tetratricopeptide (TPR) repeat protein